MAPGVCLTPPATPSLPVAPIPVGQLTSLPTPGPLFQAALTAPRYVVKAFVVPEPSERWTTTMSVPGSVAPLLSAAICGSFHFVIVLRKMPATVGPSRFSSVTPGRL